MMVGTYANTWACIAAQLNGVKRYRSMKPSSRDQQLGLASPWNFAAIQSGKTKTSLRRRTEAGLDAKPTPTPTEGRGRNFFLDILFHRMSDMEILRQLSNGERSFTMLPRAAGTARNANFYAMG